MYISVPDWMAAAWREGERFVWGRQSRWEMSNVYGRGLLLMFNLLNEWELILRGLGRADWSTKWAKNLKKVVHV